MLGLFSILLAASCFRAAVGHSHTLECGSPSSPKFTSGQSCTGCAFTAMNLNSLNTIGTESGCIAAVSGASTQLSGYPCVTIKSSGGITSCTMHQTCGTANATDSNTKSCLFTLGGFSGITKPSECPKDAICTSPSCPGEISGDIDANMVVPGHCGEIILGGTITIWDGASLTFEPGLIVKGMGHSIHQKRGPLTALGNLTHPVVIDRVHIEPPDDGYNARLTLTHVRMFGGSWLASRYGGTKNPIFSISDSHFEDVTYPYISYPSEDCMFERCVMINGGSLVVHTNGDVKVMIRNNRFCNWRTQGESGGNTNGAAIEAPAAYGTSHIIVANNTFITSKSPPIALSIAHGEDAWLVVKGNYYGTADWSQIETMISDPERRGLTSAVQTSYATESHPLTPTSCERVAMTMTTTSGLALKPTTMASRANATTRVATTPRADATTRVASTSRATATTTSTTLATTNSASTATTNTMSYIIGSAILFCIIVAALAVWRCQHQRRRREVLSGGVEQGNSNVGTGAAAVTVDITDATTQLGTAAQESVAPCVGDSGPSSDIIASTSLPKPTYIPKEWFAALQLETVETLSTLLQDFVDVKPIGSARQGGRSLIARAVHRSTMKSALLKIAPSKYVEREQAAFRRLQRVGSSLEHEVHIFVAKMLDCRLCGSWGFLWLEEGMSDLSSKLESSEARSQQDLRNVGAQCCSVLAFLHECQLGWGDCAASNILAFADGMQMRYKAVDFGEAVSLPALPPTETHEHDAPLPTVFSPDDAVQVNCCAPERLAANMNSIWIEASDAMDIWALGCVLFRLLTNKDIIVGSIQQCRNTLVMLDPASKRYVPHGDLQACVVKRLDEMERFSFQARRELLSMLQVNPCCRPSAAELLKGAYFGGARRSKSISTMIRRLESVEKTTQQQEKPLPRIERIEVTGDNFFKRTLTIIIVCAATKKEFRAETSEWRWWLRFAIKATKVGGAVVKLCAGDVDGSIEAVKDAAADMQGLAADAWVRLLETMAHTREEQCVETVQSFSDGLGSAQGFWGTLTSPSEEIQDLRGDANKSVDSIHALIETWRDPHEGSLFAEMLSQPVLLSTESDKVKQLLLSSKFYQQFRYDYSCAGWVMTEPIVL